MARDGRPVDHSQAQPKGWSMHYSKTHPSVFGGEPRKRWPLMYCLLYLHIARCHYWNSYKWDGGKISICIKFRIRNISTQPIVLRIAFSYIGIILINWRWRVQGNLHVEKKKDTNVVSLGLIFYYIVESPRLPPMCHWLDTRPREDEVREPIPHAWASFKIYFTLRSYF